tara:strand:- start:963 stop:1838 length:876 start_codon:yes stop_codon:yes gene_type:complete
MSNGIRSLPRYRAGGSTDPDQEERRRRLWQLMAERRGTPELTQEFNINEDRMENLLDSLNALGGGNTSFVRQARGRSRDFPTGRYIPTKEQAPLPHWYSQLRNPLGANRMREGYPPQISLTAAGDYASRRAGEGFEMDSSGRPMTGEWSRPERFVAMHEAGHGVDASDILPESLEIMQKESNAPMYPWQNMGDPSWLRRTRETLERKIAGTYESEKFATQFGKAIEILQDSLDPERRDEAAGRVDSPEMEMLVEELLKNPVYENHPFRLSPSRSPWSRSNRDQTGIRTLQR